MKKFLKFVVVTSLLSVFPVFSVVAHAENDQSPVNTSEVTRQKRSLLDPPNDHRQLVTDTTKGIHASIGRVISRAEDSEYVYLGTGFVVGRNTFVTNNHVAEAFKYSKLFDANAVNNAWFYPGRDGDYLPFGRFKVIDVAFSPDADIAVVTVGPQNDNLQGLELGDVVAPLTIKKFDAKDTHVSISGYPGEKQNTQWFDLNTLYQSNFEDIESSFLTYQIDTTAGQSGFPIYNDNNEVVGVHSNGNIGNLGNVGQRLNTTNYSFIVKQVEAANKKLALAKAA